jgi:hypothetical protein
MAEDPQFALNVMRMIAGSIYYQCALATSREMFGRGYLSLGVGEKAVVDQAVFAHVSSNYQALTLEFLAAQQAKQPMGFPIQPSAPTAGSTQQP